MIRMRAAAAGRFHVGAPGHSVRSVPVVQDGVQAGEAGTGAEKDTEQQERAESHRLRRLSFAPVGHRSASAQHAPRTVREEEKETEHTSRSGHR